MTKWPMDAFYFSSILPISMSRLSWGINILIYSLKSASVKSCWAAPEAAAIGGPVPQADPRLWRCDRTAVWFGQNTFSEVWRRGGGGASSPYFTPDTLTECVGKNRSRSLRVCDWTCRQHVPSMFASLPLDLISRLSCSPRNEPKFCI